MEVRWKCDGSAMEARWKSSNRSSSYLRAIPDNLAGTQPYQGLDQGSSIPRTIYSNEKNYSTSTTPNIRLHSDHALSVENLHSRPIPLLLLKNNPILVPRIQRTRRAVRDTLWQKQSRIQSPTSTTSSSVLPLNIPPQIQNGNQIQRPVNNEVPVALDIAGPRERIVDLVRVECQRGEAEEGDGCLAEGSGVC